MEVRIPIKDILEYLKLSHSLIPVENNNLGDNLHVKIEGARICVMLKNQYKTIHKYFQIENDDRVSAHFIIDLVSLTEVLRNLRQNGDTASFKIEGNQAVIRNNSNEYSLALNIYPPSIPERGETEYLQYINISNKKIQGIFGNLSNLSVEGQSPCYIKYQRGDYNIIIQTATVIYSLSGSCEADEISFYLVLHYKTISELYRVLTLESIDKIQFNIGVDSVMIQNSALFFSVLHLHKQYVDFSNQIDRLRDNAIPLIEVSSSVLMNSVNGVMIFKNDKLHQVCFNFLPDKVEISNSIYNAKAKKTLELKAANSAKFKLKYEDVIRINKKWKGDTNVLLSISKQSDYVVFSKEDSSRETFICSCLI